MSADPLIAVLIGPGGVGKGTIAQRLTEIDKGLWLSRSWTTRPQRPTETGNEYNFVDRATFEQAIAADQFLEWAEFHGNLYGTPLPKAPNNADILLEIEVQGAEQVRRANADAVVWGIMMLLSLLLLLVPFLPGIRSIPRWIPLYRIIWRQWYRNHPMPGK